MGNLQELHSHLTDEEVERAVRSRSELSGLTAVLSSQTYEHVNPACRQKLHRAIMHAANHGLTWMGDVSEDRMGYGPARNSACEQALQDEDVQGIVWVDSDIHPEVSSITRLLFSVRRFGLNFITGVYHQRGGDYQPVLYEWRRADRKWGFQIVDGYPENEIAPKAGCGFGFCYTSTKMLRSIQSLREFTKEGKWFPDTRDSGGFGEDLGFCYLARKAKYQLYVDTGVQVGHSGDGTIITQDTFRRRCAERVEDAKNAQMARHH